MANGQVQEREGSRFPPPHRPSSTQSRTGTAASASASARAPSPARGATLLRSHSEERFGDAQRHSQSAAAVSKLRQGDSSNSSGSSSPDRVDTSSSAAAAHNTEYPPLGSSLVRGNSYSKIVAGGHSSSSSYAGSAAPAIPTHAAAVPIHPAAAAPTPAEPVPSKKPQLRVDTSREEDNISPVETVVGPLEALKLATGSSTQEPAWAQPFPTPSVPQSESEEQTTASSSAAGVYMPESSRRRPRRRETCGGSSNAPKSSLDPFPPAAPTMAASASSSSSFASIDAIFSQRNESSEALAGLLGVQLDPTPLNHGVPLAAAPKDARTSRFSFANPADAGRGDMQQTTARYELLDGTTVNNRSSFGGFDAPRVGNAPSVPSAFPPTADRSGFPPLGSSQQLHHAPPPPHPSRNSFGGDFRSNDMGLGGSGALGGGSAALGGGSGGLAFLQQMLPNVNISFGGDYPTLSGGSSSGMGASTTPMRSASAGRGCSSGRRLFERSQSAGAGLVSPDSWDGGSLSSLGFDSQSNTRRASSGSSFYDPAMVSQAPSGFSNNLYGFSSSNAMAPNGSESDRLRMQNDFGGDVYRRSGSLMNNS
ncbi:hypothetical protein ON010_g11568 [Phytophthora cinnamomi]|nr:hypothetical protein ON010_g11568 [Phytophthora cinnamomi]